MSKTQLEITDQEGSYYRSYNRTYRVLGLKSIRYLTLPEYCAPRGLDANRVRETVRRWPAGLYTDLWVAACVDAAFPPPWKMPRADRDWSVEQKRALWKSQARVRYYRALIRRFEMALQPGKFKDVPLPKRRRKSRAEIAARREAKYQAELTERQGAALAARSARVGE